MIRSKRLHYRPEDSQIGACGAQSNLTDDHGEEVDCARCRVVQVREKRAAEKESGSDLRFKQIAVAATVLYGLALDGRVYIFQSGEWGLLP